MTLGIRDSLATIIRDVAELNKDDIKSCFDGRPVPIAGYLCEIRMNETCLGIGKEGEPNLCYILVIGALKPFLNKN